MTEVRTLKSATETVSAWFEANASALGLAQLKRDRSESPAVTLSAWYEAPGLLVDVTAWDHAWCLDVLAFDAASDQLLFSEAGACESAEEILGRLEMFAAWLKQQPGPNNSSKPTPLHGAA